MGGNFNALIEKVIDDARRKSGGIMRDAKDKAKVTIEKKIEEARAQSEDIIRTAQARAAFEKERIVAGASLAARDKKLKRKREIIEKTLELVVKKLDEMNDKRYEMFLIRYLFKLPIDGDETLVIPWRYIVNVDYALRPRLGDKKLNVQKDANLKGGFILIKDGVENNNSYEALIDYYREELETIIAEKLF
ncbi:MAG: hypothetical protein LBL35_04545 [Clostridiales bacterium]|jgi:V/A-type H+-transporting ATPase subunit E|nr:hypothetical protein [Clostridiales bacterium]